jgi:hypothetical protein
VIASHIPVQAQAGPAAVLTAAVREVPGVWETASVAGPCDVIFWAGTRDTGQLARLVTSPRPGPRRRDAGGRLPGRLPVGDPIAVEHSTTIQQLGEGGVQAVCSCGWRSPVFGSDKATGTMDPLQHAAEAADLHEWEMSLR